MYQRRTSSVANSESTMTCTTTRRRRDRVFSTGSPPLGRLHAAQGGEHQRQRQRRDQDVVADRAGNDLEDRADRDAGIAQNETGQREYRGADERPRGDQEDAAEPRAVALRLG